MQTATKQGMPTKHTFFPTKYRTTGWFIQFENWHASACIPEIQKIVMTISKIKLYRSSVGI